MTKLQLQAQIKTLRDELETRHKTGVVKLAAADGTPSQLKFYKINYIR